MEDAAEIAERSVYCTTKQAESVELRNNNKMLDLKSEEATHGAKQQQAEETRRCRRCRLNLPSTF